MFEHAERRQSGPERPLPDLPGPELAAALAALDDDTMSDAHIIEEIAAWERMTAWVAAGQHRAILRLARRRPATGCTTDPDTPLGEQVNDYLDSELALALGLSRVTAGRRLASALALDELPATLDALAAGQLTPVKTAALIDATTVLSPAHTTAVETAVLPDAPSQTPGQFRAALASAVLAVDPAAAQQRHTQAVTDRRVWLSPTLDGMATLGAYLPAPEALAAYNALTRIAKRLQHGNSTSRANSTGSTGSSGSSGSSADPGTAMAGEPGDTADDTQDSLDAHGRTLDQRRADTLTFLLTNAAHQFTDTTSDTTSGAGGGIGGDATADGTATDCTRVPLTASLHADIRIIVPAGTLLGLDDNPAELAGYGPITAPVARALASGDNSTWRRILVDPTTGALLENDRRTYRPSPALDDYIRTRDHTCRFEGCRQPATHADLDHTIPFTDGGPTSMSNLAALCRPHHRLKTHAPGWHVTQSPNGTLTWTTPTGTTHTTHPAFPTRPETQSPRRNEPPLPGEHPPWSDPPRR